MFGHRKGFFISQRAKEGKESSKSEVEEGRGRGREVKERRGRVEGGGGGKREKGGRREEEKEGRVVERHT